MLRYCNIRNAARLTGVVLVTCLAYPALAGECSIAKTNKDCTLTIDRRSLLSPPTIQMFPGHTLTIQVENPYYFEQYFLDYSGGQVAVVPDAASSIVGSLLTPLQSAAEFGAQAKIPQEKTAKPDCSATNIFSRTPKDSQGIVTAYPLYTGCFQTFAAEAKAVYLAIDPVAAPDSKAAGAKSLPGSNADIDKLLRKGDPSLPNQILDAIETEAQLSTSIAAAGKIDLSVLTPDSNEKLQALQSMAGFADGVAKDLTGYRARILNLPASGLYNTACGADSPGAGGATDEFCVQVADINDPRSMNSKMTTRQVTYSLDALNLVQNTQLSAPVSSAKETLATITVLYADSRWEGSAGTFFSTLPDRSFSVSPILAGGTVTDQQIAEKVLHPTIVPFVAANFRLSDDLPWAKYRSALYYTFAAGVNPNTTTADFATGLSLSWRGLMFSALLHVGHDVRLTQGLYTGESLGASFSGTATTESYWREAFAIGVSVRAPSLTGR